MNREKLQELRVQIFARINSGLGEAYHDYLCILIDALIEDDYADVLEENKRLRSILQGVRDAAKFEANSDGGWAAFIDDQGEIIKRLRTALISCRTRAKARRVRHPGIAWERWFESIERTIDAALSGTEEV